MIWFINGFGCTVFFYNILQVDVSILILACVMLVGHTLELNVGGLTKPYNSNLIALFSMVHVSWCVRCKAVISIVRTFLDNFVCVSFLLQSPTSLWLCFSIELRSMLNWRFLSRLIINQEIKFFGIFLFSKTLFSASN